MWNSETALSKQIVFLLKNTEWGILGSHIGLPLFSRKDQVSVSSLPYSSCIKDKQKSLEPKQPPSAYSSVCWAAWGGSSCWCRVCCQRCQACHTQRSLCPLGPALPEWAILGQGEDPVVNQWSYGAHPLFLNAMFNTRPKENQTHYSKGLLFPGAVRTSFVTRQAWIWAPHFHAQLCNSDSSLSHQVSL